MKRETEFKTMDFGMKILMVALFATVLILMPYVAYREHQTFCTIKTPEFTYENVRKTRINVYENTVSFDYKGEKIIYNGNYQVICKDN